MSNIVSVLETMANDATLTDLEALKQYVSEANITELQKQAIEEHSISGLYATMQNIEQLKAFAQVAPEEEEEEEEKDDEQESETEAINARLASNS